ncbi:MAG: c-type cytochrome [Verrucomicrobia bacterium]|nr:c-type cytochrome [Verrucomicrobiota bacterium]
MKIHFLPFWAVAGLGVFLSGCGQESPPPPAAERSHPTPRAVRAAAIPGQTLFESHCGACHGAQGTGTGAAAVYLHPKPRDFTKGMFKIRSSSGNLPTDADLLATVTRGMPGSSMPSFAHLSEQERGDLVKYVKHLAAYTDDAGKRVNHFEDASANGQTPASVAVAEEPPVTSQTLAEGKKLYAKMQCAQCHGQKGLGDGPSAGQLRDSWDHPIAVRDFTTGVYLGGNTDKDLYLRFTTGLAGTPMPAYAQGVMTDKERWSLVHHVQSLRRKDVEKIEPPADRIIHAGKATRSLPADPMDQAWNDAPTAQIPLNPLWPCPHPIPAVIVRAVHDGKRMALLLDWPDHIANGAPVRVQDFQDAAAVQFSMNGTAAFIGMGDARDPVNIWQWKAGWQQDADGKRQDVDLVYASMRSDMYPEKDALYRTAEAAGNLLAQPTRVSPVEDANATGFGTLKTQPAAAQNVAGKGIWSGDRWRVVFVRDLNPPDADDVKLAPGRSSAVAFAIWDGQHRDRNGQKAVSAWFQLLLEP